MTVFAALTLGLAVGPILWLARARIRGWRELAGAVAAVGTATGSALLVGTWAAERLSSACDTAGPRRRADRRCVSSTTQRRRCQVGGHLRASKDGAIWHGVLLCHRARGCWGRPRRAAGHDGSPLSIGAGEVRRPSGWQ